MSASISISELSERLKAIASASGDWDGPAPTAFDQPLSVDGLKALAPIVAATVRREKDKANAVVRGLLGTIGVDNPATAQALAGLHYLLGDQDAARSLIDSYANIVPDRMWLLLDAAVATRTGPIESAVEKAAAYSEAWPAIMVPGRTQDAPLVCVLKRKPMFVFYPYAPLGMHIGGNLIGQVARRYADRYRFMSLFPETARMREIVHELPRPDVIVSNIVNGEELSHKHLRTSAEHVISSFAAPCLNPPAAAYKTSRDKNAAALGQLQNVVVPKTKFFRPQDDADGQATVNGIASEFNLPVILRPPFFQDGVKMVLCEDATALERAVHEMASGFFAIEYIQNQPRDGLFRKIRACWIGDKLHLLRLDYGEDWTVHGHRSDPHRMQFYRDHPELLREEIDTCKDPEAVLGKRAVNGLKEVRDAIELDYFGIDFDVMDDGKVLLFEANASMNLLTKVGESLPHPAFAEDAMLADFFALLDRAISAAQNQP